MQIWLPSRAFTEAAAFAEGVTGRGNEAAIAPKDIVELTRFLTGDEPRVITLFNNFINGESDLNTGCNGYHYWTFEMVGDDDQTIMKNKYIYKTAGRGPALSSATRLHASNNVWDDVNGHAIDGGEETAQGNVFIKVKQLVSDYQGKFFSSLDVTTCPM